MNPLGRFFVCKLSATATVFSISPLWANEESGNDKQMNNNNVPINNVSMCQYANVPMGCAVRWGSTLTSFLIFLFSISTLFPIILILYIPQFFHSSIGTLAYWHIGKLLTRM